MIGTLYIVLWCLIHSDLRMSGLATNFANYLTGDAATLGVSRKLASLYIINVQPIMSCLGTSGHNATAPNEEKRRESQASPGKL